MRWGDFRKSENVEDRGAGGGMPTGGFGGGGMKIGGGAMVLLVIVGLLFGVNPLDMIGGGGGGLPMQTQPQSAPPGYGPQQTTSRGRREGSRQGVRGAGARRHRGRLGRRVQDDGRALRPAEAGPVPRHGALRLRQRKCSGRAVLLLRGQGRLPRHRVFRDPVPALPCARRFRRGLRDRPRSRPPHPEHHRRDAPVRRAVAPCRSRARATRCRCGSSCRPTATPASGGTSRSGATCWSPATSRKACAPRRRWATT